MKKVRYYGKFLQNYINIIHVKKNSLNYDLLTIKNNDDESRILKEGTNPS
jgi:hypothetical protein